MLNPGEEGGEAPTQDGEAAGGGAGEPSRSWMRHSRVSSLPDLPSHTLPKGPKARPLQASVLWDSPAGGGSQESGYQIFEALLWVLRPGYPGNLTP